MLLFADIKHPDQTAQMQVDLGLGCLHVPQNTIFAWPGPSLLTSSALQTKTETCVNSGDPDKVAYKRQSNQVLHCCIAPDKSGYPDIEDLT